jgi:hypothetical protein
MHQDHQDTDRLPDYNLRYLYEPNSHQDRFNKHLGNKTFAAYYPAIIELY